VQGIIQSLGSGRVEVIEIPRPAARPGRVVIANRRSVISAGTERASLELARKSLAGKARERPDQVRQVFEKVRRDGLGATVRAVRARLDEPKALGYSSAGVVLAVGAGVGNLAPGDRVASNGPHAEVVSVPRHLVAAVPDGVPDEAAAMTVLGAIALHGVRMSRCGLGEKVFVVGLGLVGQLVVGLLRAAGCRVVATDPNAWRCRVARGMGAEVAEPGLGAKTVEGLTGGLGADAVLVAAATGSSDPMRLAVDAVREKGRVVLVGDVGMELDRRSLYYKEAEIVVSRSYGPGRYDPEYEERGHDYPAAYVRWTEQRNLAAVLDLMASGQLDVSPLITHRFPLERAPEAYELVERGGEDHLGIVLAYEEHDERPDAVVTVRREAIAEGAIGVGVLGAGRFARSVMLPALGKAARLDLRTVVSASGTTASASAKRFGFAKAASSESAVLEDEGVDAVWILTRHDQHARQLIAALRAGKHVFVEKPLCLTLEELSEIEAARVEAPDLLVLVGFNRRFAPASKALAEHFAEVAEPLTVSIRFSAGALPADHWTQNDAEGGGRVIGEACHGIDLATYLTGSVPVRVYAESVSGVEAPAITEDQCFLTVKHANGSVSNIAYLAGGDTAFPKERVEVLGGGKVGVIDDFRRLTLVAGGRMKRKRRGKDKGHRAEVAAFVGALREGEAGGLPSWEEIRAVTRASIRAVESLRTGEPLEV